jgi:transposase
MFIRKIRTRSGTYLAEVENERVGGKVRQRVIRYLGKEIEGRVARTVVTNDVRIMDVRRYLDVEVVDRLANELTLRDMVSKEALVFVYAQLLDRPSISRMEEWLSETDVLSFVGLDGVSTSRLYDSLTSLNELDFQSIERRVSELLLRHERERRSVVLDVTDTYFQGSSMPWLARRGKEGRNRKLLQVGLAVTAEYGFPIMHRTYPGNISSYMIFRDISHQLWLSGFECIVADRGMGSLENVERLRSLGMKGIVGLKKTRRLINEFLAGIEREEIYSSRHRVVLRNTKVYCKSFEHLGGRLIAVYNPGLEVQRREHHYERGGDDASARYLGYSLIYNDTNLDDSDAVRRYYEKDIVERAFKHIKGVLDLRPVRVWLTEHVEAHVKICYLAYSILSFLSYKLRRMNISPVTALEEMRKGYRVYLRDEKSGFRWDSLVTLTKKQKRILDVV